MKRCSQLLLVAVLAWVVQAGFWNDIVTGLVYTHRFDDLLNAFNDTFNDLQTDDGEAALFICEVLKGDLPEAFEDIASDAASLVVEEFDDMTSLVRSIPTLVPQVLDDIIQGGEDAISIVEELVTNPGAAITVIENGVVSIYSEVTAEVVSVFGDFTYALGCDFADHCPSSTTNQILASCDAVLAQAPAASSTPAAAANTATPSMAASTQQTAQPTTQAAATSSTTQYAAAPSSTSAAPTTVTITQNGANVLGPSAVYLVSALLGLGMVCVVLL